MKIAVPLFGEEVSPRFGSSTHVLLAQVEADKIEVEEVKDLGGLPPWQWADVLAGLGVVKLICGGIHPRFCAALEQCGVEVIWGVVGPAAEALAALQKGALQRYQFVCPGRRRRGGGRRLGHAGAPGPFPPRGGPGGGGFGRGGPGIGRLGP